MDYGKKDVSTNNRVYFILDNDSRKIIKLGTYKDCIKKIFGSEKIFERSGVVLLEKGQFTYDNKSVVFLCDGYIFNSDEVLKAISTKDIIRISKPLNYNVREIRKFINDYELHYKPVKYWGLKM